MSDMKRLIESIDSINESFDFNASTNTITTATKQYYMSEITPELMYEWVKTGNVNRKCFIAWAVYLMESTYY